jgi:hypothetical protein
MDDKTEPKTVREYVEASRDTARQLRELADNRVTATESLRSVIMDGDFLLHLVDQLQERDPNELRQAVAAGRAMLGELGSDSDFWVEEIALKSVVYRFEALIPPDGTVESRERSEPG